MIRCQCANCRGFTYWINLPKSDIETSTTIRDKRLTVPHPEMPDDVGPNTTKRHPYWSSRLGARVLFCDSRCRTSCLSSAKPEKPPPRHRLAREEGPRPDVQRALDRYGSSGTTPCILSNSIFVTMPTAGPCSGSRTSLSRTESDDRKVGSALPDAPRVPGRRSTCETRRSQDLVSGPSCRSARGVRVRERRPLRRRRRRGPRLSQWTPHNLYESPAETNDLLDDPSRPFLGSRWFRWCR